MREEKQTSPGPRRDPLSAAWTPDLGSTLTMQLASCLLPSGQFPPPTGLTGFVEGSHCLGKSDLCKQSFWDTRLQMPECMESTSCAHTEEISF